MGVQWVKPAASMPAITGAGRSKLAKLRPPAPAAEAASVGAEGMVSTAFEMPAPAGVCQARCGLTLARAAWDKIRTMATPAEATKMMLGFVIRQCAVALGHPPAPEELAEWANNQRDRYGRYRIFGRAISADEARVILRHPGRLVTVRPGPRWSAALERS
jgi:hypothetical protein